jgi:hypothetical protein
VLLHILQQSLCKRNDAALEFTGAKSASNFEPEGLDSWGAETEGAIDGLAIRRDFPVNETLLHEWSMTATHEKASFVSNHETLWTNVSSASDA